MAEERWKAAAPAAGCGSPRTIANDEAYLCHCRMCQRATGSVSIAFKNCQAGRRAWHASPTGTTARRSRGGPIARLRHSLGFQFKEGSEKMDLTVAAFDDPSRFRPTIISAPRSMHRAWLNTEGLPEYPHRRIPAAGRPLDRRHRQAVPDERAPLHRWTASDGVELAWHEVGEGRPVILLHGLFSDAKMNWINFGHADRIAAAGLPGHHARPSRPRPQRRAARRRRIIRPESWSATLPN